MRARTVADRARSHSFLWTLADWLLHGRRDLLLSRIGKLGRLHGLRELTRLWRRRHLHDLEAWPFNVLPLRHDPEAEGAVRAFRTRLDLEVISFARRHRERSHLDGVWRDENVVRSLQVHGVREVARNRHA